MIKNYIKLLIYTLIAIYIGVWFLTFRSMYFLLIAIKELSLLATCYLLIKIIIGPLITFIIITLAYEKYIKGDE